MAPPPDKTRSGSATLAGPAGSNVGARGGLADSLRLAPRERTWSGRVLVGPGLVLFWGRGGPTTTHAHHAIQVVLGDGPVAVTVNESAHLAKATLIPSGAPHRVDATGCTITLLLVEPASTQGKALQQRSAPTDATDLTEQLEGTCAWTAPTESAALWCEHLLHALRCPPLPPPAVHPGVRKALRYVAAELPNGPTLAGAARSASLSESRLRHVFVEQVGLPFRRFVLWQRVKRAAESALRGESLTNAAHAAGFADQAHLSRTFKRMFGLPPSALLPHAELVGWHT